MNGAGGRGCGRGGGGGKKKALENEGNKDMRASDAYLDTRDFWGGKRRQINQRCVAYQIVVLDGLIIRCRERSGGIASVSI